jgi:hypothetical protein
VAHRCDSYHHFLQASSWYIVWLFLSWKYQVKILHIQNLLILFLLELCIVSHSDRAV